MQKTFPAIRNDIETTARDTEGSGRRYFVKNPGNNEIFDMGEEEYFICRQLDGQASVGFIQTAFQQQFGFILSLEHIEAFVRRLDQEGWLVTGEKKIQEQAGTDVQVWRLFNPDPLFKMLAGVFSWCFSSLFLYGSAVFFFIAFGVVLKYWNDIFFEIQELGMRGIFFWVPILLIFVINVLSEIAKGVTVKHDGGYVVKFNLFFSYRIIPRFCCDLEDSLLGMKNPGRVRVFLAGMAFPVILWTWGVIFWRNTVPWSERHTFWLLFAMAATIWLFLNLNIFIQRDGSRLLSLWLESPDLRNRAIAVFQSWLHGKRRPAPFTGRNFDWLKWYGAGAFFIEIILWAFVLWQIGSFLISSLKGVGAFLFLILLILRFEHTLKEAFYAIRAGYRNCQG